MVLRCAFFHLSRVAEDGNYYRPQRYKNADALYAFKSRGSGGEIGVVLECQSLPTVNKGKNSNYPFHHLLHQRIMHGSSFPEDIF